MPESKRPLKVFLSYASQDQSVVRELSGRLASEGWIDPWVDAKKLLPGQDWRTKIEEAVETSDIVIVVLSNNSVAKEGYVQKELRFAQEIALEKPDETIFLIPLRLDDCTVPRGLRFFQWVDYFGDKKEESFSALIESFQLRYQQVLKHEEERAQKEKEKRERELAEKIAREKTEREASEKFAREKAELEAVEKAARKMAERETAEMANQEREEKAKQEKLVHDAVERAKREKAEREASEKAAKETARRETAEKAKLERAERRVAFIAALKSNILRVSSKLRVVGITGIAIAIFWLVLQTPFKPPSLLPTTTPSATTTSTIIPSPSKISTPKLFLTWLAVPTGTITNTPASTIIPPDSILFQKDFEDGLMDEWQISYPNIWAIEQELDGNHSLCGTGQIWYRDRRTVWTDYAFETRVKFVSGNGLTIVFRHDLESNEQYQLMLSGNSLVLLQSWRLSLSRNFAWSPNRDRWQIFKVEIKGDVLSIYQDEQLLEVLTLQPPMANHGGIGYIAGNDTTDKICLDDMKVWSLK